MPPDTIAVITPTRTKHRPRFRRASQAERPAFRVTDRDREGFKIIYDNRWITAEMLQDLLSPVVRTPRQLEALEKLIAARKSITAGSETAERPQRTKREIRRRLQLAFHNGYVQRRKLSDSEPIAYALGNLGAEELVLYFGIDRQEIEWTTKNRESGERYIRHALMATGFRHALELALRHFPEASLEQWLPGGTFHAKVTYKVKTREGARTQLVDGSVKPDALPVVKIGDKRIHYFLEADRSTMSNARYLAKLKSLYAFYCAYVRGDKKAGITQMRVLTLTKSEARQENLRETAQKVSTEAKDLFWFACERSYAGRRDAVLAPIWQTLKDDTLRSLIA